MQVFADFQTQIRSYEKQVPELQEKLAIKVAEVAQLKEELDKVKSVLQQKVMGGKPDILATVQVLWSKTKLLKLSICRNQLCNRVATVAVIALHVTKHVTQHRIYTHCNYVY